MGKATLRGLKGMNDLFEQDLVVWRSIENLARKLFLTFGYGEIRTPILEPLAVFVRAVGETTDIVEKEMYAFQDRDKKATHLCLRPENTASVVRALVQAGKLAADAEERVFYLGPMFRRERPQKGRLRQFHQLGAEAFGLTHPSIDIEMLSMVHALGESLGLEGVSLTLNSLGDPEDRSKFKDALQSYLAPFKADLSEDSQRRLDKNPLRLLDAKDPKDRAMLVDAPKMDAFMGGEARAHFDAVRNGLEALGIPYKIDAGLVRGLDYYTRTVFELLADTGLGAQNAVAAGGRYDGLVEVMGGRPTPGIGFAAGIERMAMLIDRTQHLPDDNRLFLVAADEAGRSETLRFASLLRKRGQAVELDHRGRSVKAQMKRADKGAFRWAIVIGSREMAESKVRLKDLRSGDVIEMSLDAAAICKHTHIS